jgi:primosomal protein N' (replication factor Y) (superfamily II helicase)
MFYYEVAPADRLYHGDKLLTYSHDTELQVGELVVVTLQTKTITAIVIQSVKKPSFPVKTIAYCTGSRLPTEQHKLYRWVQEYYPYGLGICGSLFVPPALTLKKLPDQVGYNPVAIKANDLPLLTGQQSEVSTKIIESKVRTHIIHGDTGTGKTRLYIELAKNTVSNGKSVLMLTPEISLTPQLISRFQEAFTSVHVVHSQLSAAQRRDIWRTLEKSVEPQIIIGPRSALFLPLKGIGIIILDEFHESAYKQEQAPRYHATRVAAKLAELSEAKLVLGSATPPVEDYFYASSKDAAVYRLTEMPGKKPGKKTNVIVDMSQDSERSSYPLLSNTLLRTIKAALDRDEQVLIFHNKRGSSRTVLCQQCGWYATCSRCNIPYTYHADNHKFICHTCGKSEPTPNSCPTCRSNDIIFKGPGTKAITESLQKIFPEARIGRYDKDNTKEQTFSSQHAEIEQGNVDILVGTQLLAKGHDLPKLSVVGVLLAETGLQFPDYSSEERSYQLLHQIAGRVGRGHRTGIVILQTYNPQQRTLTAAEHKKNSWDSFYKDQLEERKQFAFPPFCYLLKIEIAKKNEKNTQVAAEKLAEELRSKHHSVQVLGPSPAFIAKQSGTWRWQIIVKANRRSELLSMIKQLPKSCSYDIDPLSLL